MGSSSNLLYWIEDLMRGTQTGKADGVTSVGAVETA